jgi:hypothetical protein
MEDKSVEVARLDRTSIDIPDKLDVPYTRKDTINSIAISVATFTFVSCLPMLSGKEIPVEYRIILGGMFSLFFIYAILRKTRKRQADYDSQQTTYADFIGKVRAVVSSKGHESLSDEQFSQLSDGEKVSFLDGSRIWMTKDAESASVFMGSAQPVS